MRVRINLPDNHNVFERDYVVFDTETNVESEAIREARLTTVRATGVSVERQGRAFVGGYIGPNGYRTTPAPGYYPVWAPEGVVWDDVEAAQELREEEEEAWQ